MPTELTKAKTLLELAWVFAFSCFMAILLIVSIVVYTKCRKAAADPYIGQSNNNIGHVFPGPPRGSIARFAGWLVNISARNDKLNPTPLTMSILELIGAAFVIYWAAVTVLPVALGGVLLIPIFFCAGAELTTNFIFGVSSPPSLTHPYNTIAPHTPSALQSFTAKPMPSLITLGELLLHFVACYHRLFTDIFFAMLAAAVSIINIFIQFAAERPMATLLLFFFSGMLIAANYPCWSNEPWNWAKPKKAHRTHRRHGDKASHSRKTK